MASAQQILKDIFGFDSFRPGQEDAVTALLAGRNVLTVMPTGSGKSLCFQVPALMADGLTIVVSPLVALMQDQVAALRLAGVAADTLNSSRDRADNVAAWRRAAWRQRCEGHPQAARGSASVQGSGLWSAACCHKHRNTHTHRSITE